MTFNRIFFILLFILLFKSRSIAQGTIYYSDTLQLTEILNGEWKFEIDNHKYKINFQFLEDSLSCIDIDNLHWDTGTHTNYKLIIERERLFLLI